MVLYCDVDAAGNETVFSYSCDAPPYPAGVATCQTAIPSYGVDCVLPAGEACVLDEVGDLFLGFCAGTDAACVMEADGVARCHADVGTCARADVGTCDGTVAIERCVGAVGPLVTDGQPYSIDCALFGAACVVDAGCLHAPGAPCTVGVTSCGIDADDAAPCPSGGVCPAEGEGEGEGE